jgi:hypothetical protein
MAGDVILISSKWKNMNKPKKIWTFERILKRLFNWLLLFYIPLVTGFYLGYGSYGMFINTHGFFGYGFFVAGLLALGIIILTAVIFKRKRIGVIDLDNISPKLLIPRFLLVFSASYLGGALLYISLMALIFLVFVVSR